MNSRAGKNCPSSFKKKYIQTGNGGFENVWKSVGGNMRIKKN
jgi:hypothetical protein